MELSKAGNISLIYRDRALDSGIVEPGDAESSEWFRRVLSEDPDEQMLPPKKHPERLSKAGG